MTFSGRRAALIIVEHGLIVLAVFLAAVVRLGIHDLSRSELWSLLARAALVGAVLQVALHCCDLYDSRTIRDRKDLITGLLRALGAASVVLALVYFFLPSLIIGRGVILLASVPIVALIAGWRLAFDWLSIQGGGVDRLLIVGTSTAAIALARELFDRRTELGVELVGFVDPDPIKVGTPVINPGVIGVIEDIPVIVRNHHVESVVVSLADARGKLNMDTLLKMKLNQGVRFDHLASMYEKYTGKIAVENLRPSWLIFSEGFRKGIWLETTKRSFDVLLATAGLLLAAPIMVIVALAVRFDSTGSVFYTQRRVGKDGVDFTIYKFRSMRADAEARTGAVWSTTGDPRVTRIGRFLRRTRLDELPQLWNVLRGDMSFIGPRPERPEFVAELTTRIPFYGQRHTVRPGVTGWAQVRHQYGASVDDAQEKLQYDLFYIKHMSFTFDLFILVETVKTVLVRHGS
jgi:sugar transferase (PEP-CTERM system associated)